MKSLENTSHEELGTQIDISDKTNFNIFQIVEIQWQLWNFLVDINKQSEIQDIDIVFLENLSDYLNNVFSCFSRHDLWEPINSLINIKTLQDNNVNNLDYLIPDLFYKIKNFLEYCLLISWKQINKKINIQDDLEPFLEKVVKFHKNKNEHIGNININYDKNINWNIEIVEWYLDILLSNILINAKKHWNADTININISEENWFLVLQISDNWTWIDISKIWWDINNIFIKWKTDWNWTWIWLADADKHMETMWWEISVENLENWTEFTIKIPLVNKNKKL